MVLVQFKPNKDKKVCQYCGYKGRDWSDVSRHVNNVHELSTWYECLNCNYHNTDKTRTKQHYRTVHNVKISTDELSVVEAPDQVEKLRMSKMGEPVEEEVGPEFIPIPASKFKPSTCPKTCQYCGYTQSKSLYIRRHVNSHHEMSRWYRCPNGLCKFTTVCYESLRRHLKSIHQETKNINLKLFKTLIVKDQEEIEQLRRKRIENFRPTSGHLKRSRPTRNSNVTGAKESSDDVPDDAKRRCSEETCIKDEMIENFRPTTRGHLKRSRPTRNSNVTGAKESLDDIPDDAKRRCSEESCIKDEIVIEETELNEDDTEGDILSQLDPEWLEGPSW